MSNILVSVIVPTKNSAQFLDACLLSIKEQAYKNIELIVVDNFSTDDTQAITRKYTDKVFVIGPERCTQRNYGAIRATGEFIVFIDSDMTLSQNVIKSCVKKMNDSSYKGIIIPEESFGKGFWAQCKKLERSFYVGVDAIEAARFFRKEDFDKVGGYNEALISGEDWDLSDRVEMTGPLERITDYIFHNEGKISLLQTLKKKYYYAQKAGAYLRETRTIPTAKKRKMGVVGRYWLYLKQPVKLFRNPFVGIGMLWMKTFEFGTAIVSLIQFNLIKITSIHDKK